jgi:hypothetical protein
LPETGHGRVDEARIDRSQRFITQAQTFQGAGAEILHQHIGAANQFQENATIRFVLEIQGDALLAAVERGEVGGLALKVRSLKSGRTSALTGSMDSMLQPHFVIVHGRFSGLAEAGTAAGLFLGLRLLQPVAKAS